MNINEKALNEFVKTIVCTMITCDKLEVREDIWVEEKEKLKNIIINLKKENEKLKNLLKLKYLV